MVDASARPSALRARAAGARHENAAQRRPDAARALLRDHPRRDGSGRNRKVGDSLRGARKRRRLWRACARCGSSARHSAGRWRRRFRHRCSDRHSQRAQRPAERRARATWVPRPRRCDLRPTAGTDADRGRGRQRHTRHALALHAARAVRTARVCERAAADHKHRAANRRRGDLAARGRCTARLRRLLRPHDRTRARLQFRRHGGRRVLGRRVLERSRRANRDRPALAASARARRRRTRAHWRLGGRPRRRAHRGRPNRNSHRRDRHADEPAARAGRSRLARLQFPERRARARYV